MTASEALRWGLVHRTAPREGLMDLARETAALVARDDIERRAVRLVGGGAGDDVTAGKPEAFRQLSLRERHRLWIVGGLNDGGLWPGRGPQGRAALDRQDCGLFRHDGPFDAGGRSGRSSERRWREQSPAIGAHTLAP